MTNPGGTDPVARRRELRLAFLRALYERVDGSVSDFVNGFEVAGGLGIDRPEAAKLFDYLEEKRWIRVDDHREGTLRITAEGIDRVEAESG